jgi:hypothetical protein
MGRDTFWRDALRAAYVWRCVKKEPSKPMLKADAFQILRTGKVFGFLQNKGVGNYIRFQLSYWEKLRS